MVCRWLLVMDGRSGRTKAAPARGRALRRAHLAVGGGRIGAGEKCRGGARRRRQGWTPRHRRVLRQPDGYRPRRSAGRGNARQSARCAGCQAFQAAGSGGGLGLLSGHAAIICRCPALWYGQLLVWTSSDWRWRMRSGLRDIDASAPHPDKPPWRYVIRMLIMRVLHKRTHGVGLWVKHRMAVKAGRRASPGR